MITTGSQIFGVFIALILLGIVYLYTWKRW